MKMMPSNGFNQSENVRINTFKKRKFRLCLIVPNNYQPNNDDYNAGILMSIWRTIFITVLRFCVSVNYKVLWVSVKCVLFVLFVRYAH